MGSKSSTIVSVVSPDVTFRHLLENGARVTHWSNAEKLSVKSFVPLSSQDSRFRIAYAQQSMILDL